MDGQKLLFLFAVLMIVIGILMLRGKKGEGNPGVHLNRSNAPKLTEVGVLAGVLSGFFGIGGGFLIVPGLMIATGMPIINAVGYSLLPVAAFGTITAANYALSGWVDWPLAAIFITGGIAGDLGGTKLSHQLADRRGMLNVAFSCLIFLVAGYILHRGRGAF